MNNFFGSVTSKILWLVVGLLVIGGAAAWFIKGFLAPPDLGSQSNAPSLVTAPDPDKSATPLATSTEEESVTSIATANEEPNSIGETEIVESSPTTVTSNSSQEDMIPAITQAEDVVVEVPDKIEKGGVLKIYTNHDNSDYPDTVRYSPTDIQETSGLTFAGNNDRKKFQEVSGFIVVPESGEYNFNVEYPSDWHNTKLSSLRLEVGQLTFPQPTGGRIKLEEGIHPISLFMWATRTTGKDVRVSWGQVGEPLEPIEIYREVKDEVASQPQQISTPEATPQSPAPQPTPQSIPDTQVAETENPSQSASSATAKDNTEKPEAQTTEQTPEAVGAN